MLVHTTLTLIRLLGKPVPRKQIKDACSYTNGDKDLFKGSCQLFNEALMCVRNEPIIHFEDLSKEAQKKVVSEASKTSLSHH